MSIEFANWCEQHKLATKQKNKFSVYCSGLLNLDLDSTEDTVTHKLILKSLSELYGDETPMYFEVFGNLVEGGLFFFETEQQARIFYSIFEQDYVDSSPVYACLYCPVRGCLTENT